VSNNKSRDRGHHQASFPGTNGYLSPVAYEAPPGRYAADRRVITHRVHDPGARPRVVLAG